MSTRSAKLSRPSSQRNPSFDLLKVAAMIYVIFGWHMDDYANNMLATDIGRTLVIGALGMFVFVSGFTLARSCGEIISFADILQFIQKRLIRIYPLYLSSLLLFFITSEITSRQFFSGLFLLNAILNIQIKTLWFVTMIFLFYLILPVVIYRFSILRVLVITTLFIASTVIIHFLTGLMDLRLAYYFPLFTLGILCERSDTLFQRVKSMPAVIISVLALAVVTILFEKIGKPWFRHYYIPACLIFSVSPLAVLAERCVTKVNMQLIGKLSYASFGMYLYHRFVFWVLLQIYRPDSGLTLIIYLFIAGFPLLYLISAQVQKRYDSMLVKLNLAAVRQGTQEVFNG